MRLSAFNVYVADQPERGMTLVYNSFTGAFAALDDAVLAVLRKADRGEELPAAERALVGAELLDEELGVVVDSREAEERAYREWFARKYAEADLLRVVVSTTFACNLDCTYCCQADVLDGKTMAPLVGAQVAAWLAQRALDVGTKRVELVFVGGEPLLQPGRIEQIVGDIRRLVGASGIDVRFGLLTNGVLLERDLVARWKPLGLAWAQVTLDGDETTHSLTRRSRRRGEDTFAASFRNVVAAAELIEISINGNYQPATAHGFPALVGKLAAAGLPPGSRVRFTPALTALGAPSDAASGSCTMGGSAPELMIPLADAVLGAGFDPGDLYKVGPCGFHDRHQFAVDPDGNVYKCPGFLGHPEWAVGHVASGLTPRYERLLGLDPQRQCGPCPHKPDCAGGCLAAEWLKTGQAAGVNCEYEFFARQKEAALPRMYALATAETRAEALARFPAPGTQLPASPVRPAALRVLAA